MIGRNSDKTVVTDNMALILHKKAKRIIAGRTKKVLSYDEPNEETIEAIQEAISGKSAGSLDMRNYSFFIHSINSIE